MWNDLEVAFHSLNIPRDHVGHSVVVHRMKMLILNFCSLLTFNDDINLCCPCRSEFPWREHDFKHAAVVSLVSILSYRVGKGGWVVDCWLSVGDVGTREDEREKTPWIMRWNGAGEDKTGAPDDLCTFRTPDQPSIWRHQGDVGLLHCHWVQNRPQD